MTPLKVLGRVTSINVRKVLWVADLCGIEYENELWGLPHRDPNTAEFVALNPNAQVPVIIDNGFALWESNAIMRYLADTRRSGLWPMDPRERALVDQWLAWQATELNPSWGYAVFALLRKNPAFTDSARIAESINRWNAKQQLVEAQLKKGNGFMANGRMSLADIAIALSTQRWFATPMERPDLPAVTAHYEALKATPEGQKYMGSGTP